MTIEKLPLTTPFITLGQLLKQVAIIWSGGQAKWYLSESTVYVNGELESRRGRKLYAGDIILFEAEQLTVELID